MSDNPGHDAHPERGPWLPVTEPPPAYETVSVRLADGTTGAAVWTGTLWWRQSELHPVGWRRLAELHSTPPPGALRGRSPR